MHEGAEGLRPRRATQSCQKAKVMDNSSRVTNTMGGNVMYHRIISVCSTCLLLGASACATPRFDSYSAPILRSSSTVVAVHQGFEQTYADVREHASLSFFELESEDKGSGTLIFSFGDHDEDRFVDCGRYTTPHGDFYSGPYFTFMKYRSRAQLNAKMTVRLRRIDSDSTEVSVDARYVVSIPQQEVYSQGLKPSAVLRATVWTFDSHSLDTQEIPNPAENTPAARSCSATGAAEKEILKAVVD